MQATSAPPSMVGFYNENMAKVLSRREETWWMACWVLAQSRLKGGERFLVSEGVWGGVMQVWTA